MGKKVRANLYIDEEVYQGTQRILALVPGSGSVSALVEGFLAQFVEYIGPMAQRAEAGDRDAALSMLRMLGMRVVNVISTDMLELEEVMRTKSGDGGTNPVDGS